MDAHLREIVFETRASEKKSHRCIAGTKQIQFELCEHQPDSIHFTLPPGDHHTALPRATVLGLFL